MKRTFKDTTVFGLTITAKEKRDYYKAMERKELEKIYNSLPTVDCKGKCADQCTVAPVGAAEEEYIKEKYGAEHIPEPNEDLVCSELTEDGKCGIHDRRPLICRLFGLLKDNLMSCPHGCKPNKWLSEERSRELIDMIIKGEVNESNGRTDSSFYKKVRSEDKG